VVGSAEDARRLAALAGAALRLVNETAAAGLIDAADRGETRVRLPIGPVLVPLAAGRIGRLYDEKLVEALEHAGEDALARACRIFGALGFAVGTALDVERETDVDRVGDVVRSIRIDHLELGFAAAEEVVRSAPLHLLQAVALPAGLPVAGPSRGRAAGGADRAQGARRDRRPGRPRRRILPFVLARALGPRRRRRALEPGLCRAARPRVRRRGARRRRHAARVLVARRRADGG